MRDKFDDARNVPREVSDALTRPPPAGDAFRPMVTPINHIFEGSRKRCVAPGCGKGFMAKCHHSYGRDGEPS